MNKKLFNLILVLLLSTFVAFNGCKKDEESNPVTPTINESEILAKHFEDNNLYVHGASFVITAENVRTNILTNPTKQLIIDIRSAADFATKHLKGAVNQTVAGLPAYFKTLTLANYDKVVIVCYSGQTSAFATSLMRAMGYGDKVVSMKWGMSSVDSSFAQNYWLNTIANGSSRVSEFVTTTSPAKNAKGDLPKLSTGKSTAAEILEARVNAVATEGFGQANISQATVYSNLASYYICAFWPNNLYLDPGHINGAIQYDPAAATKTFALGVDLKTLPTDKTVLVYCYTGQTSAFVAGYLRLLGYDAKSIGYGANGMIYNSMVAKNVANTFIPANEIKGYTDIFD